MYRMSQHLWHPHESSCRWTRSNRASWDLARLAEMRQRKIFCVFSHTAERDDESYLYIRNNKMISRLRLPVWWFFLWMNIFSLLLKTRTPRATQFYLFVFFSYSTADVCGVGKNAHTFYFLDGEARRYVCRLRFIFSLENLCFLLFVLFCRSLPIWRSREDDLWRMIKKEEAEQI